MIGFGQGKKAVIIRVVAPCSLVVKNGQKPPKKFEALAARRRVVS